MNILERFAIYRCRLGADGTISSGEPGFWRLAGVEPPGEPIPAAELFGELVGREDEIRSIVESGEGELRIPGIRRGSVFIDLCVLPLDADPAPREAAGAHETGGGALLVVRDASESLLARQSILQQRNEIALLKREIDESNAKLKTLMATVREHNHGLREAMRAGTRDIRRSRLSIIAKLARVAEFRDQETGGHIYRIGRSCVLVGRSYGLSGEDCEDIFHASLLHDVGKVGIPDSILLKPGPLSPEERAVIQTHTIIGADILSGDESSLMDKARDVARFHHERWDGRGYPEARIDESIPLMARICSIVDVFDALLSKRPYKEAWRPEDALSLIRSETGRAFDPRVARAFFEVVPDILKLRLGSLEGEGVEELPEFY